MWLEGSTAARPVPKAVQRYADGRHPYAELTYAATLAHVGCPFDVPAWHTPVLLRPIPGGACDAMGPYPVCVLPPGAELGAGLAALRAAGAVSVVLVSDPLCGPDIAALVPHFTLCRPFKTHYLIDRDAGPVVLSKHHRDRVRRGERRAAARLVSLADPAWRAEWVRLYAGLCAHRGIAGLQAFPRSAFDALATLPADRLLAFAAEDAQGAVLAMQLWIRHGDCAYSHLTATSEAGYRVGATYVVYAAAIAQLSECRLLDLGGGAGLHDDPEDSLAQFKRGFANAATRTVLCGAILDPPEYARLTAGLTGSYFPLYRTPR